METENGGMDPDLKAFIHELGVADPKSLLVGGEPPDPLDEEKIRAFQSQKLSKEERRWIAFLITRYRVWNEACERLSSNQGGED